jgi:hypothetical protein
VDVSVEQGIGWGVLCLLAVGTLWTLIGGLLVLLERIVQRGEREAWRRTAVLLDDAFRALDVGVISGDEYRRRTRVAMTVYLRWCTVYRGDDWPTWYHGRRF